MWYSMQAVAGLIKVTWQTGWMSGGAAVSPEDGKTAGPSNKIEICSHTICNCKSTRIDPSIVEKLKKILDERKWNFLDPVKIFVHLPGMSAEELKFGKNIKDQGRQKVKLPES